MSEDLSKKYAVVTTVSSFYHYYVVPLDLLQGLNDEQPVEKNWLEDLVVCHEVGEFSQKHIGEQILESSIVDEENILKLFDIQNQYLSKWSKEKKIDGGLYMPILFRKEHFLKVNGYPEGNLKKDSDIFSNKIALPNEEQVPGDKVLIKKLATIGIKHQTAFNSIIYHFQCGEQDSEDKKI